MNSHIFISPCTQINFTAEWLNQDFSNYVNSFLWLFLWKIVKNLVNLMLLIFEKNSEELFIIFKAIKLEMFLGGKIVCSPLVRTLAFASFLRDKRCKQMPYRLYIFELFNRTGSRIIRVAVARSGISKSTATKSKLRMVRARSIRVYMVSSSSGLLLTLQYLNLSYFQSSLFGTSSPKCFIKKLHIFSRFRIFWISVFIFSYEEGIYSVLVSSNKYPFL